MSPDVEYIHFQNNEKLFFETHGAGDRVLKYKSFNIYIMIFSRQCHAN